MKIVVIGGTGLIGSKTVRHLQVQGHEVVAAAHAPYFGAELDSDTLIPGPNPLLGALNFDAWFARSHAMQ